MVWCGMVVCKGQGGVWCLSSLAVESGNACSE